MPNHELLANLTYPAGEVSNLTFSATVEVRTRYPNCYIDAVYLHSSSTPGCIEVHLYGDKGEDA